MVLTKTVLAEMLSGDGGLSKYEARNMVEIFFENIRDSLASNEQVENPVSGC